VVRILPPISDKCIVELGKKFGCHPKRVPHLLELAKQLNLNVVGVRLSVCLGLQRNSQECSNKLKTVRFLCIFDVRSLLPDMSIYKVYIIDVSVSFRSAIIIIVTILGLSLT